MSEKNISGFQNDDENILNDANLDNINLFEDVDFWTDIEGVKTIAAVNDGNSSMKYF